MHAAAHVGAVFVIATTALVVAWEIDSESSWRAVFYYMLLLAASYVVGTAIYALYLAVAQHRKRSVWALFPMLAHEGWKNFLRIRVTDEELTVYALGAQRVPKKRKVTWDDANELHVTPAECCVDVDRLGDRPARRDESELSHSSSRTSCARCMSIRKRCASRRFTDRDNRSDSRDRLLAAMLEHPEVLTQKSIRRTLPTSVADRRERTGVSRAELFRRSDAGAGGVLGNQALEHDREELDRVFVAEALESPSGVRDL